MKTDELGDDDMMAFLKEISIMSSLKHENILKFKGACLVDVICLVTEFAQNGDLRTYLQKNIVDTFRKLDFALQIAKAVVSYTLLIQTYINVFVSIICIRKIHLSCTEIWSARTFWSISMIVSKYRTLGWVSTRPVVETLAWAR